MSNTLFILLGIALLIVGALAFYAGKLLFQLKQQTQKQQRVRQKRIADITESIQTIAAAVEQQQCNLSEGAIRLIRLLEALPVKDVPDCKALYPSLYELFTHVKELPTHQDRKQLTREVREQQDTQREEHEARLESKILEEVKQLKGFTAQNA